VTTASPVDAEVLAPPRSERSAALLGLALGVAFLVCFVTGIVSHLIQDPPSWFTWPPRPAGLYRVTQGVHVTTGLVCIPLLVAKLWVVHPKLFERPTVRPLAHAVERVALLPLVGGATFLLLSGLGNVNIVRPYPFGFRDGHLAAAWITMGALVVHVAAKWAQTRPHLTLHPDPDAQDVPDVQGALVEVVEAGAAVAVAEGALDRRGFLAAVAGTSGLVALLTVGQAFEPLRSLAVLAPRRPDIGPQGFPVNRTAASVGLTQVDLVAYRLVVDGPGAATPLQLTYDDLRAMDQHEAELPIACVEGWSTSQRWRGVRVRDLVAAAGGEGGRPLTVISMQDSERLKTSEVNEAQADDPELLLALEVGGEVLHADHGFPARLIGPNRPGVQQTKWVARIEVA
jgi:DMSO/TMAO reductase YedYZ molybdopterin-dependent catalytic subunit